jgi:hypothetical protein
MAFPNAVIRASKLDADYWLNDANENAAPVFLRPMFEGDRTSLKPHIDGSRCLPFDPTASPARPPCTLVQVDAVSTNREGSSSSQHAQRGLRYRSQPRPQSGVSMCINVCWTIKANKSGPTRKPLGTKFCRYLKRVRKRFQALGIRTRGKALILTTTIWGGRCSKCSRFFRRMIEKVQGVPRA